MSSINPNNINGSYPIAGQDNDSQGFRDNFTNVKNNLTFAKTEIEDIQTNAILKVGLSGTTLDNNLNNAILKGAQCLKFTETVAAPVSSSGALILDWAAAHYQHMSTTESSILTFANWPTSGFYTKLRFEINVTSVAHTLTLPSAVSVNLSSIQGAVGQIITFPATGKYVFEFTTYDNGTTITIEDVLRTAFPAYQYSAATTGFNDTVGTSVSKVIYDPAATIANGTITLPTGNVDARTVTISSTQIITAFQILPSFGTTIKAPGNGNVTLAAGSAVSFFYHATETKWYKIA
jgi:hypothetical protein